MTGSGEARRGGGLAALRERDARFLARHEGGAWFRARSIREHSAVGVLRGRGYLDPGVDGSARVNDAGRAYLAGRGRSFRQTTAALRDDRPRPEGPAS